MSKDKRSWSQGGVVVTITGVERLDKALAELEPKAAKKIETKALREAARPVLAAAKDEAPTESGKLQREIKIRGMKRSRRNHGTVGVRVVTGEEFYRGEVFYGAFINFGRKTGTRHSEVRRKVDPDPFMNRAYEKNKTTVPAIFADSVARIIEETGKEVAGG